MIYAGFGTKEAPVEVLAYLEVLGGLFAKQGFTLRSVCEEGPAKSFQKGNDKSNGNKEIFLPKEDFGNCSEGKVIEDFRTSMIAERFHPYWDTLSEEGKKLHETFISVIMGKDLKSPCDFIVCWLDSAKDIGGMLQTLELARVYNIPVINVFDYESVEEVNVEVIRVLEFLEGNLYE